MTLLWSLRLTASPNACTRVRKARYLSRKRLRRQEFTLGLQRSPEPKPSGLLPGRMTPADTGRTLCDKQGYENCRPVELR